MLLDALQERVVYLFKHKPEKLLTAVYLLDIAERRYKEAMSGPDLAVNARRLAQVILERESEKIASRKKYSARPDAVEEPTDGKVLPMDDRPKC